MGPAGGKFRRNRASSWPRPAGSPITSKFAAGGTSHGLMERSANWSSSALRGWGQPGLSTTSSSSPPLSRALFRIGIEGHYFDGGADGPGQPVHRIVGDLQGVRNR